MGTPSVPFSRRAALNVNLCHNIETVNPASRNNGAVNAQTLHGLLNVLNVNNEAAAGNNTGVAARPPACVESFVQTTSICRQPLAGTDTPSTVIARS